MRSVNIFPGLLGQSAGFKMLFKVVNGPERAVDRVILFVPLFHHRRAEVVQSRILETVLTLLKAGDRPTQTADEMIEEKDIIESYQLGANSYICKPVDFTRFANAVQQLGLYWLIVNQFPN